MTEKWKVIEDTNKAYSVSNFGFVRSNEREVEAINETKRIVEGKILSTIHSNSGDYINLFMANKKKKLRVDELVANAFIRNPKGYKVVGHKDGNMYNNRKENLYWYNKTDAPKEKSKGMQLHRKLEEFQAAEILLIYTIDKNIDKKKIARDYHTTIPNVDSIIYRRTWKYLKVRKLTDEERKKYKEMLKKYYVKGNPLEKIQKKERL